MNLDTIRESLRPLIVAKGVRQTAQAARVHSPNLYRWLGGKSTLG